MHVTGSDTRTLPVERGALESFRERGARSGDCLPQMTLTDESRVDCVHTDQRPVPVGAVPLVLAVVAGARAGGRRLVHRGHVTQGLTHGHAPHGQLVAVGQRADIGQSGRREAVDPLYIRHTLDT